MVVSNMSFIFSSKLGEDDFHLDEYISNGCLNHHVAHVFVFLFSFDVFFGNKDFRRSERDFLLKLFYILYIYMYTYLYIHTFTIKIHKCR